jgi:hypothetical protein
VSRIATRSIRQTTQSLSVSNSKSGAQSAAVFCNARYLGLDSRKVQIADGAAGIPPILPFSLCDDRALLLTSPGNLFGGARLSL